MLKSKLRLTTEKSYPAVLTPPMKGMLPGVPVGAVLGALELEDWTGDDDGGGALDTLLPGRHWE